MSDVAEENLFQHDYVLLKLWGDAGVDYSDPSFNTTTFYSNGD